MKKLITFFGVDQKEFLISRSQTYRKPILYVQMYNVSVSVCIYRSKKKTTKAKKTYSIDITHTSDWLNA